MADAFKDSLDNSLSYIKNECGQRVDVPEGRRFAGLDAYAKAIQSDVDVVLLCTPPGFRPAHFEAAVAAGKHVFMEKPLATDAPGVRRVLAANAEAKKKKLAVAVGHHLRHETKYREIVARIHDGAIGDLTHLRAFFNDSGVWIRPRLPGQTEMQYQVRNWYYFTWLSGDHIVEQHVHDLDVCNWIAKAHPLGSRGHGRPASPRRQRRRRDLRPSRRRVHLSRRIEGVQLLPPHSRLLEFLLPARPRHERVGQSDRLRQRRVDRARQDADDSRTVPTAIRSRWTNCLPRIVAGQPYNEVDSRIDGTMTAILGRMATYSGKIVTWDDAVNSTLNLAPKSLAWDAETPVKPRPDGTYACAIPGVTKAW